MSTTSSSQQRSEARLQQLLLRRVNRKYIFITGDAASATPQFESIARQAVSAGIKGRQSSLDIERSVASEITRAASTTPSMINNNNNKKQQQQQQDQDVSLPSVMRDIHKRERQVAPTPHIPVRMDKPQEDLWASLAKQEDDQRFEIAARAKAIKEKKKDEQKKFLDAQVELKRRRVKEERDYYLSFRSVVDTERDEWEHEQQEATKNLRGIAVRIKADREEQVELRNARRVEEKTERFRQDEAILKRIDKELQLEVDKKRKIKEREVRFREELIAANEEQKRIQQAKKKELHEIERSYVKLYDDRLKKQEEARNVAWDKMKDKMKGKEAMALELQATYEEQGREDEARAEEYQIAHEQAKIAKADAEVRKKKEAMKKILSFQAMQLQERAAAREVEVAQKIHEKQEAKQVCLKLAAEEKEVRRKARQKIVEQKAMLEEQLEDNSHFFSVKMSDEEFKLNQRMLSRAQEESASRQRLQQNRTSASP